MQQFRLRSSRSSKLRTLHLQHPLRAVLRMLQQGYRFRIPKGPVEDKWAQERLLRLVSLVSQLTQDKAQLSNG
jgi:hypothetical protein